MIYFNSDYLEGAHPEIMKRLAETNMVQTVGYGEDEYCTSARARIRRPAMRRMRIFTFSPAAHRRIQP